MSYMFYECNGFNTDLSSWGPYLGNVTNMSYMFFDCQDFNQPLDSWGPYLGNVTNMSYMFYRCIDFNQDLSSWNVTGKNVVDMFMRCNIDQANMPTGIVVENVVARPARVDALQVHREAGKIHYELLKNFFETHGITPLTQDNIFSSVVDTANTDYINYIKNSLNINGSLTQMIDKIDSTNIGFLNHEKSINLEDYKTDLKDKLKRIYTQITSYREDTISNYGELNKYAYMALEYASKQPTLFQIIYVNIFINDSINAYDGLQDNISCARGIIERLIMLLKDTCVQLKTIGDDTDKQDEHTQNIQDEHTQNIRNKESEYKNLTNILVFKAELQDEIISIMSKWYDNIVNNKGVRENFIKIYPNENDRREELVKYIKKTLLLPDDNIFVQNEYTKLINEIIETKSIGFSDKIMSGDWLGGSRRTVKKRRTSKQRGVAKNIRTTKKRHYKKHRLTVKKRRISVKSRFRK